MKLPFISLFLSLTTAEPDVNYHLSRFSYDSITSLSADIHTSLSTVGAIAISDVPRAKRKEALQQIIDESGSSARTSWGERARRAIKQQRASKAGNNK